MDVKAVHVMNMNMKRAMVTDAVIVTTFLPCIKTVTRMKYRNQQLYTVKKLTPKRVSYPMNWIAMKKQAVKWLHFQLAALLMILEVIIMLNLKIPIMMKGVVSKLKLTKGVLEI